MIQVHAGRIKYFYNCWLDITKNPVVRDWIQNGFSIPFCKEVIQNVVPRNNFSNDERRDMKQAIEKLIDLGAISSCSPRNDQFISKIFLTPKSNGGKRFILNLKPLNKCILPSHFKMEDYRTAAG